MGVSRPWVRIEWDREANPEGIGVRVCRVCGQNGPIRLFKQNKHNSVGHENLCRHCYDKQRGERKKRARHAEAGEINKLFLKQTKHVPLEMLPPQPQTTTSAVVGELYGQLSRGALDATRLSSRSGNNPLDQLQDRVQGRIAASRPWTRADVFRGFQLLGFVPGGLYVPDDAALGSTVAFKLRELGQIVDEIDRDEAYRVYQRETEQWARDELPGRWTWQQALARSEARFRIARWGRRGGKSVYAAAEGAALALVRQRAVVWCTAKTDDAVGRCFNVLAEKLGDRGYRKTARLWRNASDNRYIELENGSVLHGISLSSDLSAAGTGVDFLILDEAEYASEQDWTKKCLPTLADKMGKALIISSAQQGDESWFNQRVEQAIIDEDPNWETFDSPSWINFYRFPQGRESQAIKDAEREHARDPAAFLAIYGGKPTGERDRIYYAYKPSVHLYDELPFNPWQPVICVADPSGGINEYCVLAFQDYGADRVDVVDEFYRAGVTAEEVASELDQRLWRNWVSVIYLDQGANPIEIMRWAQQDWPAAPIVSENRKGEIVPGKPDLDSSVPIVNNTFRNPLRWRQYERELMTRVLRDAGFASLDEVPERIRPQIAMDLEERLVDSALSGEDLEALRDCSGIRISKERCPNLARELISYRKLRRRDTSYVDPKLIVRRTQDHACDVLRYFCWMHRRHLWQSGIEASTYLQVDVAGRDSYQGTNWLESVRLQLMPRRMRL